MDLLLYIDKVKVTLTFDPQQETTEITGVAWTEDELITNMPINHLF